VANSARQLKDFIFIPQITGIGQGAHVLGAAFTTARTAPRQPKMR